MAACGMICERILSVAHPAPCSPLCLFATKSILGFAQTRHWPRTRQKPDRCEIASLYRCSFEFSTRCARRWRVCESCSAREGRWFSTLLFATVVSIACECSRNERAYDSDFFVDDRVRLIEFVPFDRNAT